MHTCVGVAVTANFSQQSVMNASNSLVDNVLFTKFVVVRGNSELSDSLHKRQSIVKIVVLE